MDLYTIKRCFNCPNRIIDLNRLEEALHRVMWDCEFNNRLGSRVDRNRPLHHQLFHLAIAGCPNSCSQPQIKDFGVQGQARPRVIPGNCDGCGACAAVCPENAITIESGRAVIDFNTCLNCGQCARICPIEGMRLAETGHRVLIGGKLGRRPRLATEMLALADVEETAGALRRCVETFLKEGRPGERFGSLVERIKFCRRVDGENEQHGPIQGKTRPRSV